MWKALFVLALLAAPVLAQTPVPPPVPVDYGVINIQTGKLAWSWNNAGMPKLAAWVIYCGPTSGNYPLRKEVVPVGTTTIARETLIKTVTMTPGKYVCAVAAKPVADPYWTESAKSNEVAFEIPVPIPEPIAAPQQMGVK